MTATSFLTLLAHRHNRLCQSCSLSISITLYSVTPNSSRGDTRGAVTPQLWVLLLVGTAQAKSPQCCRLGAVCKALCSNILKFSGSSTLLSDADCSRHAMWQVAVGRDHPACSRALLGTQNCAGSGCTVTGARRTHHTGSLPKLRYARWYKHTHTHVHTGGSSNSTGSMSMQAISLQQQADSRALCCDTYVRYTQGYMDG